MYLTSQLRPKVVQINKKSSGNGNGTLRVCKVVYIGILDVKSRKQYPQTVKVSIDHIW